MTEYQYRIEVEESAIEDVAPRWFQSKNHHRYIASGFIEGKHGLSSALGTPCADAFGYGYTEEAAIAECEDALRKWVDVKRGNGTRVVKRGVL